MTQVCEGIRVLDFSDGMAGAITTMVLADNGAEVVKLEPPAGDPTRRQPAARQWHRGKKSVVIDLASPAGQADARRLAAGVDVVVESFRLGDAEALGVDYASLARDNPSLVYCSITGFGPRGRYARYKPYDAVVEAKSGHMMDFQGQIDRDGPIYTAVPVAAFSASQLALQGIMGALYVRERTGNGQRVATSLLQGVGCFDMFNWLSLQLYERFPEVFPTPYLMMGASLHYLAAASQDGHWVQFANASSHLFRAMVECMDLEEAFADSGLIGGRGLGLVAKLASTEEYWELLLVRMLEKPLDEWMRIFMANRDVSVEPFRTPREAMEHPQTIHNRNVIELDDPEAGRTRQVGPLIDFSDTPAAVRGPAPALGQHTADLLSQPAPTPKMGSKNVRAVPRHPFEGITALELAGFFAAPFGTTLLAEMGARVIKVEPLEGDPMRPLQGSTRTIQGKESVALDLKTPEGKELFYALVKKADALMHNYRPGVPERLGIDFETLRKLNPNLVYVYAASYGSSGPYAGRPAFHPTYGAICGGVRRQTGEGTPPPPGTPLEFDEVKRLSRTMARANEGNPDPNSAVVVGTALAMGLYARERTGRGQYIETTMLCSNLYANSEQVIDYAGMPPQPIPDAGLHGLGALYRLYRCREGWAFLACLDDEEWRNLVEGIGRADLMQDPRFARQEGRDAHGVELAAVLEGVFKEKTAREWEECLTARDVACVVADAGRYADFFYTDPHMREAGMIVEVEHPAWGRYLRHSPSVDFSLTPGRALPGNRVGEDTRRILEELGYPEEKIVAMRDQNAVLWPA